MADFDLTIIEPVNLDAARTLETDFVTGHAIGKLLTGSGAISAAVADVIMGVVIRAGSAGTNGNKTLVLVEGEIRTPSVHGLAAGAKIFSDGDSTASDAKPAGAAGTRISELGYAITTTRAYFKVTSYEKGA